MAAPGPCRRLKTRRRTGRANTTTPLRVVPEDVAPETHSGIAVTVQNAFWTGDEATLSWEEKRGTEEFTFGYALTVHKAQGSQWDSVIVFDEAAAFREGRLALALHRRDPRGVEPHHRDLKEPRMNIYVPLSALHPGGEIDSRSTGLKDGLKELAASIEAHGLILPLAVRDIGDGGYQVVDGNRRLEALKMLAKRKKLAKDASIAVNVIEADDGKAREASLAANIVREPLHPVDQFEAFAALAAAGQTAAQIAGRFGITERHVRQRMALGALHPDIRAEWRKGKIDQHSAEAFTIARDTVEQKKAFEELKKKGHLYAHMIRSRLGANQDVAGALRAIGLDAYRAAGGSVIEDLFGDNNVIGDPDLVRRLYAEALKAECDRYLAQGWAFALDEATVTDAWRWPKIELRDLANEAEQARIETIDARLDEISSAKEATDVERDEKQRLSAEREAIEAAIMARGASPEVRATAGILVSPRFDGPGFDAPIVRRPQDAAKPKAAPGRQRRAGGWRRGGTGRADDQQRARREAERAVDGRDGADPGDLSPPRARGCCRGARHELCRRLPPRSCRRAACPTRCRKGTAWSFSTFRRRSPRFATCRPRPFSKSSRRSSPHRSTCAPHPPRRWRTIATTAAARARFSRECRPTTTSGRRARSSMLRPISMACRSRCAMPRSTR
jgi:ParB/RepB/Spo0J family partition protein